MAEETLIRGRYPRGIVWSVWSGILSILSIYVALFYLAPIYGQDVDESFCLASSFAFAIMFFSRFIPFFRIRGSLVKDKSHGRRIVSGKGELYRSAGIFILTVLAAASPVLLMALLPPVTWFSVMLGGFFGIGCGDILFFLAVRLWERSAGLRLYRYRVYSLSPARRALVEYGLKALPEKRELE